jgi:fibronectin-binding autotransporter adhesin
MKLHGIKWRHVATTFLFAVAVIGAQFARVDMAHAASTVVWTGAGGNANFSTAANWQGGVVPINGDTIKFTDNTTGADVTLHNDTSVVFGGLIVDGSALSSQNPYGFTVAENVNFAAGAILSEVGSNLRLYMNAGLTTTGALTINGAPYSALTSSITMNGVLSVNGTIIDPSTVTGATAYDMQAGSSMSAMSSTTVAVPVTFASTVTPTAVTINPYAASDASLTFSGAVTLNSNIQVDIPSTGNTIIFSGPITYNGFTITRDSASQGTLNVNGTVSQNQPKETTISDSQPTTDITVVSKETTTLDGTRQAVTVDDGGTLKGTGTAEFLVVRPAGIVAPGHSPGTLTVVQTLSLQGTYQAELQTAKNYDQLVVGQGFSGAGNAVMLNPSSVLSLSLYPGWSIAKGDTFTIIDNKSATPVSGTFTGLAEGSQVTVSGVTFSISYVGGDGNDVVLTALTTAADPAAPNTGVANFVKANPVVVLAAGVVAAAAVFIVSRRRA